MRNLIISLFFLLASFSAITANTDEVELFDSFFLYDAKEKKFKIKSQSQINRHIKPTDRTNKIQDDFINPQLIERINKKLDELNQDFYKHPAVDIETSAFDSNVQDIKDSDIKDSVIENPITENPDIKDTANVKLKIDASIDDYDSQDISHLFEAKLKQANDKKSELFEKNHEFYKFILNDISLSKPSNLSLVETDYLSEQLQSGSLPSIDKRIPLQPLIMDEKMGNKSPGIYGGKIKMLMGKNKDIRRMVVYGYSRLVGYDENLNFVADIAKSFINYNNKEFIFKLREDHKWSDGHPLTSEDFKFYWQDVTNNNEINPFGPNKVLLVNGELPEVLFPDDHTVIYRWQEPNPYFLPALANARPLFLYQPKHYLKQFHPAYGDIETLNKNAQQQGKRNWAGLFLKKARQYKLTNPQLPSLQPWVNTTNSPAERYIFKRNPFFHRIDKNGRQMPYIDEVVISIVSNSLIPAKVGAGEANLQGHYLRLDNYTFLKEGEARNNYQVRLWNSNSGSHKALYLNFNSNDPLWRDLVYSANFRQALSLGIDRHEINQVVFFGLANESNNTVLPTNEFYSDELRNNWAQFDPDLANQLLDEIGLQNRNKDNIRLRADGKPLEIIIHTAGESTEETDILELIHDHWLNLGIKLYTRPSQREVFRERIFSGEAMISIWSGLENATPTFNMPPYELAPTRQDQYQWPKWGQYYETKGEVGSKPDLAVVNELLTLNENWSKTDNEQEKRDIWKKMLKIHSEQIFSIGIVNSVPQPVVVTNNLKNVPEKAFYAWSPTAYFGVYHPDIFWYDNDN